jgi:hypothetical protein
MAHEPGARTSVGSEGGSEPVIRNTPCRPRRQPSQAQQHGMKGI